eukprot:8332598-Pyramimonas_sp.AAC.2
MLGGATSTKSLLLLSSLLEIDFVKISSLGYSRNGGTRHVRIPRDALTASVANARATGWTLRAIVWMLRATWWTLRANVRMPRATWWTLRALRCGC